MKTMTLFTVILAVGQFAFAEGRGRPGGPGGPQHYGCFPQLETAAQKLRYSVQNLGYAASRHEYQGQTQRASEQASRQVGAYQYQLYRVCDTGAVLLGRDRVRDALDQVRQAFRASAILSSKPDVFQAFRSMVTDWETLRDLVSDVTGGSQQGCFRHIEQAAIRLQDRVQYLSQVASRYEDRGQTQYTASAAAYEIGNSLRVIQSTCDKNQMFVIRDNIRNRLDGVRMSFRASPVLPNRPEAFNAFRDMVTDWETFRDLVSDLQ